MLDFLILRDSLCFGPTVLSVPLYGDVMFSGGPSIRFLWTQEQREGLISKMLWFEFGRQGHGDLTKHVFALNICL